MTKKQKQALIEESINMETGEILENIITDKSGKLGKVIINEFKRPDGSVRITEDYSNCVSMAEQHGSMTVQELVDRYKPDQLAAYIAARDQARQPIIGHDFSQEPSLQDALNTKYYYQKYFNSLDPKIQAMFKSPLDFLKHVDNPANAEKLIELGIFKKPDIEKITNTNPMPKEATPLDGSIEGSVAKK